MQPHLLATDRVYLSTTSPQPTAGSYPAHFTLTPRGGIVSVALSLGSPPVAISNCLVLCCPDFPPDSRFNSTIWNQN